MKQFVLSLLILFPAGLIAAPLKLTLNWKPEPQFGGFYAAQNQGFFKKAGLEVDVQPGGSGTPTIQMLAAGSTDYAVVSGDEIVMSHARGAEDVVAIFAVYQTNPQGIMTHSEKGYQKLDDLLADEKATLLWQAGLPYAQYLKKQKKDFKVKTAPYPGGIANFQRDPQIAQQCFLNSEPLAAKKANIQVKVFLVAEQGYNPYTTVLTVRASRLKEKPDEVKKMVQAVREGWDHYLQDPAPTNKQMHSLNKAMDPTTFSESAAAQLDLIQTGETKTKGLGTMTDERWKTLADQLVELKIIKKAPAASALYKNL